MKNDVYYNGENLTKLASECLITFYMRDEDYEKWGDDMVNELITRTAKAVFPNGGVNNGEKG